MSKTTAQPRLVLPKSLTKGKTVVFLLSIQLEDEHGDYEDYPRSIYTDVMLAIKETYKHPRDFQFITVYALDDGSEGSEIIWTTDCIDRPEENDGTFDKYWPDGFPQLS